MVVSGPDQDPVIRVNVNGRPLELMADCGAAFTCIRPDDATHLPMSGKHVRTIGFEGVKQLIPTTQPVELQYKDQKTKIPILVSEHTPIALLGRDALCRLNCTIKCTPDGCQVEVPFEHYHQLSMMAEMDASLVYWIGDVSEDLLRPAKLWEKFIAANMPGAKLPEYPLHCTLQYFKDAAEANPDEWMKQQPEEVQLNSSCIIMGPQGAAMKICESEYLSREYDIKDSTPHVTLMIAEDCEQKDVGAMMAEAEKAIFVTTKENPAIWKSKDQRFIKIMISAQGRGQPQTALMTNESMNFITVDQNYMKDMLQQVPERLWSQHSTDIGFVKSAQPVKIELRPGAKPPWKAQYPLKEEAVQGIESQIEGLLKAGVLRTTQNPQSNTPLLPVKKPDGSYRLVHDLRVVNDSIVDFPADVPDPHTLLAQVPVKAAYFTVIDLCGAFFSVPIAEESKGYFGFTYKGQAFEYNTLPQGFKHSPHIFNKILKDDLGDLGQVLESTVIQYVDDILLCSTDKEMCHRDSMRLLQMLAEKGHKVSQKKLQYCSDRVVYLGQEITQGHRGISEAHLEAIRKVPKPRTVREMMGFLGIAGYSSAWVEDYTRTVAPLRAMIKETGSGHLHCNLVWTPEGHLAFEVIKQRLQEAPALALPDYSKNFVLYVSSSAEGKYACAVLAQPTGTGTSPQPVAYYSSAYSEVELGMPPCYRAMSGVYQMYEKASAVTMGYPVTILTHHSLRNLLNYGKYTLTVPRIRDYYRMLEQEDVTLAKCTTINPAEMLPTAMDGEPHDCLQEADKYSKLRSDLKALPLRESDLEYWTDGSCYRIGETLSAGYAIVKAQGTDFVVEKAEVVPQPCSAQLAELIALTEACTLAEGKRVTIYTDSSYAHNVCHLFGAIWKGRGFKKTDGSPIQHHAQILKLLHAMMKPKQIAIAKCAAHKTDASRVTRGNKMADETARAVAGANKPGKVLLVTHEVELEEHITLRDIRLMQEEASMMDKHLWLARGASQDSTGLWRNHEGLVVAPPDLVGLLIQEAHGLSHVARGEVKRKITQEYGFWTPYLLAQIDHVIGRCTICLKNNIRKGVLTPPGYIPTPNGPMREIVIDFADMIRPIEGKRYLLVVVDRFSRWVEACATKRKDAQSVAKFLCREFIPRWGLPDRISSDNGREFVDKCVKLILQKLGIKQRLGSVYRPQSQGICERMNGVVKNRLMKICEHTGLNWHESLPLALMACRSSELRELRMTPHELVMGRRMPMPCLRTSGKGPSLSLLEGDMRAYVKYLSNLHRSISTYVSKKQAQEDEDKRTEEKNTIYPGDKVFVKVYRRKWFHPRREGPYEVVRSTGTAVQIKGSPTWHHVNNCVKAPREDEEQEEEDGDDQPPGEEDHEDGEDQEAVQDQDAGEQNAIDLDTGDDGDGVHASDEGGSRDAAEDDGRRFETIDFQHVPDQAGVRAPGCGSAGVCVGGDDTTAGPTQLVPGGRSRPVRKRNRPKRFEDYS